MGPERERLRRRDFHTTARRDEAVPDQDVGAIERLLQFHQAVGNRGMQQILRSAAPEAEHSRPAMDRGAEAEADRVADSMFSPEENRPVQLKSDGALPRDIEAALRSR